MNISPRRSGRDMPVDPCESAFTSSSSSLSSPSLPALSALSSASSALYEFPLSSQSSNHSGSRLSPNYSRYMQQQREWKVRHPHDVASSSSSSLSSLSSNFFVSDEPIYEKSWAKTPHSTSSPQLDEMQKSQDLLSFSEAGRGSWSAEVRPPFNT